jgi:hypothetical protein
MLKVALSAAAVAVAASTAMATNIDLGIGAAPAGDATCHPIQSLDLVCATRAVDADGDGTVSATELASFAAPAPSVADWKPHAAGLAFKDAATEPAAMLPATLDSGNSRRLIPALFALGALVILLRSRPT